MDTSHGPDVMADDAPRAEVGHIRPGEASLQNGIHILTSVILVVVIASSLRLDLSNAVLNLLLSAMFGFIYFFGSNLWEQWAPPAQWAWIACLSGLWLAMVPVTDIGIYLILPLYYVYLRVLDDYRGVIAVVVSTLVSFAVQLPDLTVGGVMGPAISALVMVAIYYSFSKLWQVSQERQVLIDELMVTRGQLAQSEHAAGIAAERQRIAHEIHDTVAQGLSSIQMLLHAAERDLAALHLSDAATEPVRRRIDQARQTASDNLGEARAMIAALQPAALEKNSLHDALQRAADSFGATAEVDIEVDSEGEEFALPMKIEAALLRIAQGAVGNMVKHSGATRGRITVSYAPDEVRMDVVDNGCGFDPEQVEARPAGLGHVGLSAMRRRASEIGGQFIIESSPGSGTAISVCVPLGEGSSQAVG
ncbi:sensor histidine kinase [Corynebacterium uberis]|uniref:sensor histidine kinase n=1 Tax=Corynebacterium uberis TaxID=2883169 RepID=UPI001D0B2B0B|nr:sensor histidine kinase [Corynebacterium uberis]UDL84582.1 sensor histidine kinase [Corynebacterium uberis]